jgi:hypothetical protein
VLFSHFFFRSVSAFRSDRGHDFVCLRDVRQPVQASPVASRGVVARLLDLNDLVDGAGGPGSASKPAPALDYGKATGFCDSCNNGDAGREDSSSCALVVCSPKLTDVLQRNSCGGSVYYASQN